MASGVLQKDGTYCVVGTKEEQVVVPTPNLNSACGRAEAEVQVQKQVEEKS